LLDGVKTRNLLNVAVSRAQEKFIIIGCRELFDEVKIYEQLYDHISKYGYVNKQNCCKMCGEEIYGEGLPFCSNECEKIHRLRFNDTRSPPKFSAQDGHHLRSNYEVRIDDWFHQKGI
jgi:hypothetical protein